MASSSGFPCAACKFLRRKCMPGCIFAPYFPPEEPQKFANVHKVFGASNVTKLLNDLLPHQREDAVNSLAYEAEARMKDPVYGCVGAISVLQRQVHRLQQELEAANADLLRYACGEIPTGLPVSVPPAVVSQLPQSGLTGSSTGHHHQRMVQQTGRRPVGNGGTPTCIWNYQGSGLPMLPYAPPWINSSSSSSNTNLQPGGDQMDDSEGGENSI